MAEKGDAECYLSPSHFDSAQCDGWFDPETSSGEPPLSMAAGLNVPLTFRFNPALEVSGTYSPSPPPAERDDAEQQLLRIKKNIKRK